MLRRPTTAAALLVLMLSLPANSATAQTKPNILVIFGDDIGMNNISAYGHGVIGYQTPNIDRSPAKAHCSPTITASKAARRAAPRSSPDRYPFELV